MKVGIITFHTALNYGAVFQTFALFKTLQKLGADVKVIDYRAPFNEKRFAPKPLSYFFRPREIFNIIFRNSYQRFCPKAFSSFVSRNIDLTMPKFSREDLELLNNEFDCFITGSDQVWNLACTEGDDSYYLTFVNECKKKNSYAASFGYTQIPEDKQALYTNLLQNFNNISVRESSGIAIVKSLVNKEAKLVLDPTLLLNKNEWAELADYSLVPTENYLLMYLMSEDKTLINQAKVYAKQNNLKVIYLTQRLFDVSGVKNIRNASPEQWLGLFLKANAIATNSFHGLVFSINFSKHLITKYIPRSIANSRIETMINLFQLQSNLMDSTVFRAENRINYESVESLLLEKREFSINYLNRIIHG